MALNAAQIDLARLYLADQGTSAVQSIQITNATSGTFTISFDGQTTAPIQWDAGANDVQNALCSLSNIGVGGVTVNLGSGIPGSVIYVVYFAGDLEHAAQPMFTVNTSSLSIGSLATVSLVTAGGVMAFSDTELNAFYADGGSDFRMMIMNAFNSLAAFGAKWNDYVAGQTQEKKSQSERFILEQRDWWLQWSIAEHQVSFSSLQSVPPEPTAVPNQPGIPATSLSYLPPFNGRGRGGWGRIR